MASINFPNSPTVDDTFTSGNTTWKWNGTVWMKLYEIPIASQGEAETGTDNTKLMTPLRTAQAIAEFGGGGGSWDHEYIFTSDLTFTTHPGTIALSFTPTEIGYYEFDIKLRFNSTVPSDVPFLRIIGLTLESVFFFVNNITAGTSSLFGYIAEEYGFDYADMGFIGIGHAKTKVGNPDVEFRFRVDTTGGVSKILTGSYIKMRRIF